MLQGLTGESHYTICTTSLSSISCLCCAYLGKGANLISVCSSPRWGKDIPGTCCFNKVQIKVLDRTPCSLWSVASVCHQNWIKFCVATFFPPPPAGKQALSQNRHFYFFLQMTTVAILGRLLALVGLRLLAPGLGLLLSLVSLGGRNGAAGHEVALAPAPANSN